VVASFGRQLKMVSLLAPEENVRADMRNHYGEHVAPALLERWQNDPGSAPGRLTSSPWPDRIEILEMERNADGSYAVKGEIVEVAGDEASAVRDIALIVRNIDGRWLIEAAEMGNYKGVTSGVSGGAGTGGSAILYDNRK